MKTIPDRKIAFFFQIDDPKKVLIFGHVLVSFKGLSSAICYLRVEYVFEKGM